MLASMAGRKCHCPCPFYGDTAHHRLFSDRALPLVPFDAIGSTDCSDQSAGSLGAPIPVAAVVPVFHGRTVAVFQLPEYSVFKERQEGKRNPLTTYPVPRGGCTKLFLLFDQLFQFAQNFDFSIMNCHHGNPCLARELTLAYPLIEQRVNQRHFRLRQ